MYQQLIQAIDWTSVKITAAISVPAFISGSAALAWLGGISLLSNIIYNAIKIRKELKNK